MTRSHAPLRDLDFACPYPSHRAPVMGRNVVATSQPLAAQAGLRMLLKGGNAVDAALAAAMTLTVVEPSGCGLGSDAFAIVWDGTGLHGLNGSGRAPSAWTPDYFAGHASFPERGWDSVTVPGAVSTWAALSKRFGKLPFATLAEPAIHYARHGHMVAPAVADIWRRAVPVLGKQPGFAECFLPEGRALRAGECFKSEAMAQSLELIAASEGEAFYRGALAEKIAAFAKTHGGAMTVDDLAAHEVEWYSTITKPYAGAVVHELPPNGQGIATLMGLGMIEALGVGDASVDSVETLHLAIEATKLAYADLYQFVADADHMRVTAAALTDPAYLAARAKLVDRAKAGAPDYGAPRAGGTVYLTAADESGMMVSFIQSNYEGFGSGVVVSGTGISLQNRGFGFTLQKGHANEVAPRKRPFHTIIPGFVTEADGAPLMSFGLMGGAMQAQGHLQMMLRVLRYGQNPQAAADAPRWRITGGRGVSVEPSMDPATVDGLKALGHEITVQPTDSGFSFGGAQLIVKAADGYIAGSDPRKDGQAVAY
jgi:gamma-glutamyltranspeptidase/glutathione hydrolase